jgi:hypothetical protein
MSNRPESTRQLLQQAIFRDIQRRSQRHDALLSSLKACLPIAVSAHCVSCVARDDGCLVVFTDSPAWATQLRFLTASMLAALRTQGEMDINHVFIRNFHPNEPTRLGKPMNKPSQAAIQSIQSNSLISSGDKLGGALARLGATMERYAKQ